MITQIVDAYVQHSASMLPLFTLVLIALFLTPTEQASWRFRAIDECTFLRARYLANSIDICLVAAADLLNRRDNHATSYIFYLLGYDSVYELA